MSQILLPRLQGSGVVLFIDALYCHDLSTSFALYWMHCHSPATVPISPQHLCWISVRISVRFFLFLFSPLQQPQCCRWFGRTSWDVFVRAVWIWWPPVTSIVKITKKSDVLPLQAVLGMILYPAVCDSWTYQRGTIFNEYRLSREGK